MQRARAVLPGLGDGRAVAAEDFDVRAVRPFGGELETGGVDDAIDVVFFAEGADAILVDVRDADALCVDQVDVGLVEGFEIFVMETRALAELVVPSLQRQWRLMWQSGRCLPWLQALCRLLVLQYLVAA